MTIKTSKNVNSFGAALRTVRLSKICSMKEVYSKATGRTCYAALELDRKHPTQTKVDGIAGSLNIHP